MLDFLGTTENFPAIANVPWSLTWRFRDNTTGQDTNLDGTTFEGRVYVGENRQAEEIFIRKSDQAASPGTVIVSCPGLPAGRWPYEIYATNDSGEQTRMVCGHIGVVASMKEAAEDLSSYTSRTMLVRLPGAVSKQLKLQWLSSTVAAYSAQQAYDYYKKTRDEANRMQEAAEKVEGVQTKLEGIDDAVRRAEDAAADASRVHHIGENDNWWLGEEDTGHRAIGRDGQDGQDGLDGAPGQDGLDADAITSLYLESEDELPTPGDKRTVCYIPVPDKPGEFTIYRWLTTLGGESEWRAVNTAEVDLRVYALKDLSNVTTAADTYGTNYPDTWFPRLSWVKAALQTALAGVQSRLSAATLNVLGLVKLGTRSRVNEGAVVGLDDGDHMRVPLATASAPGSVKIATSPVITGGGMVGYNAKKQLVTISAGYKRYGVVCFGTKSPVTPNNRPHCVTITSCDGNHAYNSHAGNMEGSMCINLAQRGCLRYNEDGPNGENTGNSLWLSHDDSLNITESGSLSIKRYLDNYITDADLEARQYVSLNELDSKNFMLCSGGIKRVELMSEEDYAALATKASDTLYLCY